MAENGWASISSYGSSQAEVRHVIGGKVPFEVLLEMIATHETGLCHH